MPEFPDIELYLHALRPRVVGQRLEGVRIRSPFLMRSVDPPLSELIGRPVTGVRRLGKRIAFLLEDEYGLILHLMIAGRLAWKDRGANLPGRRGLAAFDFESGTLVLTEAGTKRRASLFAVRGLEALEAHDPGGIEILEVDAAAFGDRLRSANHTLKRALCDPRLFSGVGNAYSDEILHRARLSPVQLTSRLTDQEVERLYDSSRATLAEWRDRLVTETGDGFPGKVTAFRPGMAVHGRFGEPCPDCGAPVQRIVYATRETNYCARCQTAGRMLADRSLSRLLKSDWPKSIDELEW